MVFSRVPIFVNQHGRGGFQRGHRGRFASHPRVALKVWCRALREELVGRRGANLERVVNSLATTVTGERSKKRPLEPARNDRLTRLGGVFSSRDRFRERLLAEQHDTGVNFEVCGG